MAGITADSLNFADIPHEDGADNITIDFNDDKRGLLAADRSDSSAPTTPASVWSLDYYRVFFNVSTKDVTGRLLRTLIPKDIFYQKAEIPDLYAPFWIVTTLVVILAVTGNFASYIHFLPSDKQVEWHYDFEKVTIAASVFYFMITVVPIVVYFAMTRIGVTGQEPWLTHIISLYGYSFFPYVPAAVICVTPIDMVRWLVILLCFLISSYFLVKNIGHYFPEDGLDWDAKAKMKGTILLACIVVGQAVVALITKVYFFHYAALASASPDTPAAPEAAAAPPAAPEAVAVPAPLVDTNSTR